MSHRHRTSDDLFDQLHELVLALVTEQITPPQWALLQQMLEHDAEARRLYLKLICDAVALRRRSGAKQEGVDRDHPLHSPAVHPCSAATPSRRLRRARLIPRPEAHHAPMLVPA